PGACLARQGLALQQSGQTFPPASYGDGADRQGMGSLASSQLRVLLERVRYHHGTLPCNLCYYAWGAYQSWQLDCPEH
ncbi:hypothetical protein A2U01_0074445, partial [Trifolium medium]|nr:hypothetical protein [Trifolium medium]